MKLAYRQWIVAACLAAAVSSVAAQKQDTIVVDGTDWMSATPGERRAFLAGVANMIIAETAHAKRVKRDVPPVSAQITRSTGDLKFAEIEARITRWYEVNADKRGTPVLGVVWTDIVKRR